MAEQVGWSGRISRIHACCSHSAGLSAKHDATGIFPAGLQYVRKYTTPTHHSHLPCHLAGGTFRPYPASNLPALYPFGYGAYLYACLRARTGRSTHAFASGFPLPLVALAWRLGSALRAASVRLGLDFAQYLCHSIRQHHLAAGPCPAHNITLARGGL